MRPGLAVPSVPTTLFRFALLKAALRMVGFARTWRWIRTDAHRTLLAADADSALVASAEYAVAMAAALYPGHAACLERSLVLYWSLRRAGVPVEYRMGVQMYPFLAHAWVEYQGVPINDVVENMRRFLPVTGVEA
jgi:hypothetical protein